MTTITILRSDMLVFCLDEAITLVFGKDCSVVKEGLVGLPCGTVEINGKAYDWVMSVDRFRFTEA
jgi:hypothetical protein